MAGRVSPPSTSGLWFAAGAAPSLPATWGWLTLAWAAALLMLLLIRVADYMRSRDQCSHPEERIATATLSLTQGHSEELSRGSGRPPLTSRSLLGTSTWGTPDWPIRLAIECAARIDQGAGIGAHATGPSKSPFSAIGGGPGRLRWPVDSGGPTAGFEDIPRSFCSLSALCAGGPTGAPLAHSVGPSQSPGHAGHRGHQWPVRVVDQRMGKLGGRLIGKVGRCRRAQVSEEGLDSGIGDSFRNSGIEAEDLFP